MLEKILTEQSKINVRKEFNYVDYQELLKEGKTKIIGVWDDHDYGKNNGGLEYQRKNEMRKLYLDFIEEPLNSSRYLN